MPEFDVSSYLAGDACKFHGVASEKHPEGKTYIVPPPSAADELRLRRIVKLQGEIPEPTDDDDDDESPTLPVNTESLKELAALIEGPDGEPVDFEEKLLGPAYQQMVDDGVPPSRIEMLAQLVMTTYGVSAGAAQLVVRRAEGEARAANRAERRAASKKAGQAKPRASSPKAGPSSSRASSAKSTRSTAAAASTRGSATSAARAKPAKKTA